MGISIRNRDFQRGVTLVSYEAISKYFASSAKRSVSGYEDELDPATISPTPVIKYARQLVHRYSKETESPRKLTSLLPHLLLKRGL
jgi:hypothetical protein